MRNNSVKSFWIWSDSVDVQPYLNHLCKLMPTCALCCIHLILPALDTRKPVFGVCEQQSRRPAWASARSSQLMGYLLMRKYHIPFNITMPLIQESRCRSSVFVNNKVADQPAHWQSLISAFVGRLLESTIFHSILPCLDTRKPVFNVCEQQRHRTACASTWSGQLLGYSLIRKNRIWPCY